MFFVIFWTVLVRYTWLSNSSRFFFRQSVLSDDFGLNGRHHWQLRAAAQRCGAGGCRREATWIYIWLVVLPILKNMSSSMGRMTSHIFMENKIHGWNHQPDIFIHTSGWILKIRDQLWPSNIGCLILDSAMFFADLGPKRAPFLGSEKKCKKTKPKRATWNQNQVNTYYLVSSHILWWNSFFVKVKSRHVFWSHPYICLFVLVDVQLFLVVKQHNCSSKPICFAH